MKKLLAGLAVAAALLTVTGCTYKQDPTNLEEVQEFEEFKTACEDAGGAITRNGFGYWCDMEPGDLR